MTTGVVVSQPDILAIPWVVSAEQDDDHTRTLLWMEAKAAWLNAKFRKSRSLHTRRAYERDWFAFFHFIAKPPWAITARDADAWRAHLHGDGLADSTVRRKIAALSSFYKHVLRRATTVGPDGVERPLYSNAAGAPRANPFTTIDRPKVAAYGQSRPLSIEAVRRTLALINQTCVTGARDAALILTYIYTGRRSHEIATLKWEDIHAQEEDGRIRYTWTGKGGGSRTDELPPPAYAAIINYLKVSGRIDAIAPADYIWRPLWGDRAKRLPNVPDDISPLRHITTGQINRIVKRRFSRAGVPRDQVHTHTLRHTAAHLRWRDGQGQDMLEISEFLGHASIAITQIYLSREHRPIDAGWTDVEQLIALS